MAKSYLLSVRRVPASGGLPGALSGGERVLWHGRCAVAEFADPTAVDTAAARWELPPSTEVLVTDRRMVFAHPVRPVTVGAPRVWPPYQALRPLPTADPVASGEVAVGEVRWQWPQHLAVHPGDAPVVRADAGPVGGVDAGRPPRIGLVCETRESRPMLVLAAGDLAAVSDADRLANLLRRTVVQFRLDHTAMLGLPEARERQLARLLIDPEFSNYPGGPGQSIHVPGAVRMAVTGMPAPRMTTAWAS